MALEDQLRINGLSAISATPNNSGIFRALQRNYTELQRNSRGIGRLDQGRRFPAARMVFLTEETVGTLYLLGGRERIARGQCRRLGMTTSGFSSPP
jgi:hypothetical protein